MRKSQSLRLPVLGLAFVLGAQLGPTCGGVGGIRFDAPAPGALRVDGSVQVGARVGTELAETSLELEIAGVALADALGLTPPFQDEGGFVVVAGHAVAVTGFSIFSADGTRHVQASLDGLPPGPFQLRLSGTNAQGGTAFAQVSFRVVDHFTLDAADVPSAGLPGGAAASGSEGTLANASLGQAIAAPPLSTLGGQTIRSGHVEKAEALIGGGP